MKTKSDAVSAWNPDASTGPAGNVMPYTAGGPGTGPRDPAAESFAGASTIDGVNAFMGAVAGNTDTGVSHEAASINLNSSTGLQN